MPELVFQYCGFDSTVSGIIARGTQGDFEIDGKHVVIGHVDIVVPEGLLGAQHEALGGQPSGVWVRPADYLQTCGGINPVRVTIDCTQGQYDSAIGFAREQIGKPYDLTALAENFVLGRDWRNPDAWFCSELSIEAANHGGIFKFPLIAKCNHVSPALGFAVMSTCGMVELVS